MWQMDYNRSKRNAVRTWNLTNRFSCFKSHSTKCCLLLFGLLIMSLCRNERARTSVSRTLTRYGTAWHAAQCTDLHFITRDHTAEQALLKTADQRVKKRERFIASTCQVNLIDSVNEIYVCACLLNTGWSYKVDRFSLILNPLMWRIWWAPNNASRWQLGFNLAFKGLNLVDCTALNMRVIVGNEYEGDCR
jgi:hypothetical protein